jgi:hypothetical protein
LVVCGLSYQPWQRFEKLLLGVQKIAKLIDQQLLNCLGGGDVVDRRGRYGLPVRPLGREKEDSHSFGAEGDGALHPEEGRSATVPAASGFCRNQNDYATPAYYEPIEWRHSFGRVIPAKHAAA